VAHLSRTDLGTLRRRRAPPESSLTPIFLCCCVLGDVCSILCVFDSLTRASVQTCWSLTNRVFHLAALSGTSGPCGALWLHGDTVYDCSFFSVLTRMVSYAVLAVVAVCGVFLCHAILHEQSVPPAGRRRLHFALLWGGRAERYLLHRAAVCFSLVGLMPLIDISIVGHQSACLYWYVPHRRIASAISATFRALRATLRHPLAPRRHGL
jgi:hypothetical protein